LHGFDDPKNKARAGKKMLSLTFFLQQPHALLHTSVTYTNVQDEDERVGGRSFGGIAAVTAETDLRCVMSRAAGSSRRDEKRGWNMYMKRVDLSLTANQVHLSLIPHLVPEVEPGELVVEEVGTMMTHHVGLVQEQKFDGAVSMSYDYGMLDDPRWEYVDSYIGGLILPVVWCPIVIPGQLHELLQY